MKGLAEARQNQAAGDLKDHPERDRHPKGNTVIDHGGIPGKNHQKPERDLRTGIEECVGQH